MLSVRQLKVITGLSAEKFADVYGLSARNVVNWVQGYTTCPEFVNRLLEFRVRLDLNLVDENTAHEKVYVFQKLFKNGFPDDECCVIQANSIEEAMIKVDKKEWPNFRLQRRTEPRFGKWEPKGIILPKDLRCISGLSTKDFCEKYGIARNNFNKYQTGERKMSAVSNSLLDFKVRYDLGILNESPVTRKYIFEEQILHNEGRDPVIVEIKADCIEDAVNEMAKNFKFYRLARIEK